VGGSHLCTNCGGSPNLTPYQPLGWSDKIVVSKNTGDNLDDTSLSDNDSLYIDYAVINNGNADINQTYYDGLYVDGVLKQTFTGCSSLDAGYYCPWVDYLLGTLSAGTHSIKIVTDYDSRVSESNEYDNQYTKTITVLSAGPVTSEGVSIIGANGWHQAGYTGSGVKIAVIDGGFKNYESLLGRELPNSVITNFYGSGDDIYGTEHGTACAEIIHDIAPDAQFFFTQPQTLTQMGNAVNWCINQGVDTISYSVNYNLPTSPLDGTGYINEVIVDKAINNGIVWVNSMANNALAHWSGNFNDPDGDGWLNFSGEEEINSFETWGEEVTIGMIWNDSWGSSSNDYDLLVFRSDDLSNHVAISANPQDGDDDPWESITFTPTSGVSYCFTIGKASGVSKTIHVNILTQNRLQYSVPATSLLPPADNRNVIAVGAVPWNNTYSLEDFSSRGPTTDGRIKPDLAAPDRVSTFSKTPFFGTSAACPHVAGASALVLDIYPQYSPSQVKSFLESRAVDRGSSGKDNMYGSGLVKLGAVPPPSVNHLPQLSQGSVSPASGTYESTFTFSVKYYDEDGDSPTTKRVTIDNQWNYDLGLSSGSASNGTYSKGLPNFSEGNHTYYFYFTDGQGGSARLPTSGTFSGPTINAIPTAPPTPTLVYPANNANITSSSIRFQWGSSTGATKYHVQLATNVNFDPVRWGNQVSTTSATYNNLPNGNCFWRVRAGNNEGWSDWSNTWRFNVDAGGGSGTCKNPLGLSLSRSCGAVWESVTITVTGGSGLQYKYFVNENSYCDSIGNLWVLLQDWTTTNTITWAPDSAGLKTIVVWTAMDTNESCTGMVGASYSVGTGGFLNCKNATDITLDKNCSSSGGAVTITVNSSTAGMQYKYFVNYNSYCTSPGNASWQLLKDWTTINSQTWTPPNPGLFTIIVWTAFDTSDSCTGMIGLSYEAE